ncbi:MAG: Acetolactate synthase small subunit (EC [uncultured Campylobacterales bacterium]|uniref:Acetolactate synthase small subunit n=1 Tax=uncultured Campylobacterales bacterium TaxID=352960 RepID=A0A6S6T7V4_9BACT|nr:MAG: Acetolactate synthase small subunit (EC [uncultured Campylobacterales bacterium]
MQNVRRIISVIVKNEHGVLSRVAGLFAGRGYNINSLSVAPIPESDFSRFTIVTSGNEKVIEQIVKQLNKLIPIYKVIEHEEFIEKEMALVKLPLETDLSGIDAILKAYHGSVANASAEHIIVMAVDDANRIENFIKAIARYNPIEIVRSGSVAIEP